MYKHTIDHSLILEAYKNTKNIKQIERDFDGQITENTIKQILSMHNILSWMKNPINQEMQKQIINMYNNNKTVQQIHEQLHLSKQNISAILKSNNIMKNRTSKYNFNKNYFEVIDNEHKAYWLGFLYADGYVI